VPKRLLVRLGRIGNHWGILNMLVMGGVAATRKIVEADPRVCVIAFTASDDRAEHAVALWTGRRASGGKTLAYNRAGGQQRPLPVMASSVTLAGELAAFVDEGGGQVRHPGVAVGVSNQP
jgi:hypothetical protein